jgi:zinc protease
MNKLTCMTLWLLISGLQGCLALADTEPPRLQSLAELDETASAKRALKIRGWKSPVGGKVLFIHTPELPMFDLHVSFPAGSARDGEHPGLAAATFSLLNEGVAGKDLAAITETFDGLGARFAMSIDQDQVSLSLRSLTAKDKSDPALALFTQILGQPLLAEEALVHVKKQLVELINAGPQNPESQSAQAMNDLLMAGHPYARPVLGTEPGVAALSREQIRAFHRQAYTGSNARITLVGDLTLEQAQAISLHVFNRLPAGAELAPVPPVPRRQGDAPSRHIERATSQTQIMLGQPSVPRLHPDYVALTVGHTIFGDQKPTSRLMTELREKRGVTYGVHLKTTPWQGGGSAIVSLKTSPQFSEGVVNKVKSMYREFLQTGPTQQELDDTLRQLRSHSALNSSSNAQILTRLVAINHYNLPLDLDFTIEQAQGLTTEQIKTALNRHFDPDQWSVVTVGPTVEQQPLPLPISGATQSMCRAEPGIVAS